MKLIESTWVEKKKNIYHDSNFHSTRYPMNTESSSDHMATVHQAVLIAWIQSARQFWSHDYSQPSISDHMTTVGQFWSHEYCQSGSFDHMTTVNMQFWSHDYCQPSSSDHMTTVGQAIFIRLLSGSFDHMNTVYVGQGVMYLKHSSLVKKYFVK